MNLSLLLRIGCADATLKPSTETGSGKCFPDRIVRKVLPNFQTGLVDWLWSFEDLIDAMME